MSDRGFVTATPFQQLISLFTRAKEVGLKDADMNDWWNSAELAHQAMSILGIPEAEHQGYDPSQPARPVEDREPGMPVYPPFGQSGVPLVDDNGAPFPEETQQLFREVAQDAYLRGTRDQRDREPVGPYAPTRTGPTIDRDGNITYPNPVGEAAEAINGKINALTDVMGERFGRIDTALTKLTDLFVDSRDEIERTMTRPEYLRWKEGFDFGIKGFAEEMATARRETREAFERGRQQGDADRAQRGELATDEEMNAPISDQAQKNVREALMSAEEHRHRGYEAGFSGGKIVGAVEREAELLDQGWTPPGAVRELEVTIGPTDYEVWRDALTLSATSVFPIDGTGEEGTFDGDRRAQILADAEWFRTNLLVQVREATDDQAEITRLNGIIDSIRKATHELEGLALMSAVSAFCNAAERKT